MSLRDLLEEDRLGAAHVLDRLTRNRLRQKADEVDRVARAERHADFALGLHAADPRAVAGARIDHDDRRLQRIDRRVSRRDDAHERVINRPAQGAAVKHHFSGEAQHMRRFLGRLGNLDVAPLVESLEKQYATLPRVRPIFAAAPNAGFSWTMNASSFACVQRKPRLPYISISRGTLLNYF